MIKEKKPYSVFTVLLCIMFLAVFIVLPPVCRKYFPKKEKEVEMIASKKYILECDRIVASESLRAKNTVEFKNTELISYTLNYEVIEPTADDVAAEKALPPLTVKAVDEMNFLKGLNGVNAQNIKNSINIVLTPAVLDNNNPELLEKYFSTKGEIKKNLESQGYTCTLK